MSDIATKLTTIAENQQKVYDAGYIRGDEVGRTEGYNFGWDQGLQQGTVEGKQAEYNKMWDVVQHNGTTDYVTPTGYFCGKVWNYYNFYPKYDIKPVGVCAYLFYGWETRYCDTVLDLKQRLIDCGVELDTRNATNIANMFSYSRTIHNIPTIDCTGLTTAAANVFSHMYENPTIEKLIVNETVTYSNWFTNATGLVNIRFEGVIGQSINFQWSTNLSKASITNDEKTGIIDVLSSTASGMTLTLSKRSVTSAFGSTTADEWTALIATKPNWTISLV